MPPSIGTSPGRLVLQREAHGRAVERLHSAGLRLGVDGESGERYAEESYAPLPKKSPRREHESEVLVHAGDVIRERAVDHESAGTATSVRPRCAVPRSRPTLAGFHVAPGCHDREIGTPIPACEVKCIQANADGGIGGRRLIVGRGPVMFDSRYTTAPSALRPWLRSVQHIRSRRSTIHSPISSVLQWSVRWSPLMSSAASDQPHASAGSLSAGRARGVLRPGLRAVADSPPRPP